MIQMTFERIHSGYPTPPICRKATAEEAFGMLVENELGFGGQVLEVTPTRVVVRTNVLSCVDTATFEGNLEEMRHLFEIAAYYSVAMSDKEIFSRTSDKVFRVLDFKGDGVKPLHLHLAGGMLFGASLIVAILEAVGDFRLPPKPRAFRDKLKEAVYTYLLLQEFSREEVLSVMEAA